MRGLMRLKRAISYKNFVSTSYVTDSQGRKTGRTAVEYSAVKVMYGSVSAITGQAVVEMFGVNEAYDRLVVVDDTSIDISESSILWLEKEYAEGESHDYVVRKIIRNRNYMTIGCKRVDVRNEASPSQSI